MREDKHTWRGCAPIVSQSRQPLVEACGEILFYLPQRTVHLIVVVQQPFGSLARFGSSGRACQTRIMQPLSDRANLGPGRNRSRAGSRDAVCLAKLLSRVKERHGFR